MTARAMLDAVYLLAIHPVGITIAMFDRKSHLVQGLIYGRFRSGVGQSDYLSNR